MQRSSQLAGGGPWRRGHFGTWDPASPGSSLARSHTAGALGAHHIEVRAWRTFQLEGGVVPGGRDEVLQEISGAVACRSTSA